MTDQLISFETAKLAKEKGFEFDSDKAGTYTISDFSNSTSTSICISDILEKESENKLWLNINSKPTQSLLQKWLREEHNIDIIIKPWTGDIKGTKTYAADITIFGSNKYIKCSRYNTYEEALEIGLQSALNLIP